MFGLMHMLSPTTKNPKNKGNDGDIAVVQKINDDNKSSQKKGDITSTISTKNNVGDDEKMENTEISSISPNAHGVDGITTPRSGLNGDMDDNCAMDTSSTPIIKSGTTIVPDKANPPSKKAKLRIIKLRTNPNLMLGRGRD